MRTEDIVRTLQERQATVQKSVFGTDKKFDAVDFAKAQGRYLGLGEAVAVISDAVRKDNADKD